MNRLHDLPYSARLALFGVLAVVVVFLGVQSMRPGDPATAATGDPAARADVDMVVPSQVTIPEAARDSGEESHRSLDLSMPLDDRQIEAAATRAVTFTESYLAFAYDRDMAAWVNSLQAMTTANSQVALMDLVPTGAWLRQVQADQTVTTARVTDLSVDLVASSTVTFEVVAEKTTTGKSGKRSGTTEYLLTVNRVGATWKVFSLYLADGDMHSHAED